MTIQPGDILEMPCVTAARRFRHACLGTSLAMRGDPHYRAQNTWLWELWASFELWSEAADLGDYVFPHTTSPSYGTCPRFDTCGLK
jgi:hypothetical protein